MKFTARECVFLAVLVAIPLGAWWFVFRPRAAEISRVRQEIQAKRDRLAEMSEATEAMTALESDIDQYNEAIAFLQSKLPQEKEMDEVLREVWRLAQTHRLSAKSIRTLSRTSPVTAVNAIGPYAEQPIALELEGGFREGLYSFLLDLERTPRITRIHQLDIEPLPKGTEGQVRVAMVMSVFFERGTGKD